MVAIRKSVCVLVLLVLSLSSFGATSKSTDKARQLHRILGRFTKYSPPTGDQILELDMAKVNALRQKYERQIPGSNMTDVIANYDRLNGAWINKKAFHPMKVAVTAADNASAGYACSGLCCSRNVKSIPSTTTAMPSNWLTNAMYQGARVQIWTWKDRSNWGPVDNKTARWTGQVAGFEGQPRRPATDVITVIRLSKNTVRLRTPGGGYVAAYKDGYIRISFTAIAGTVFQFTRVGVGNIQFRTIFGTFVSWGQDQRLYHWSTTASTWETHLIYEIRNEPAFRGVNLGGWLFPESWMTPTLWNGVPTRIDGYQFQLQSVTTKRWALSTPSTTPATLTSGVGKQSAAGTFILRRVTSPTGKIQIRNYGDGSYWRAVGGGGRDIIADGTISPSTDHTFILRTNPKNSNQVMFQAANGNYVRNVNGRMVCDVKGSSVDLNSPSAWKGSTAFNMVQTGSFWGTYQLCAGLGRSAATTRLKRHWATYIKESDWAWIKSAGLNAVRLPIGYWLTQGNNPDYPYPPGGYIYLDWAFKMAAKYNIRIFISMHSAPGGSNGLDTRDGTHEFSTTPGSIDKMLTAVKWVAQRYGKSPMFAGINLLNEPDTSISYDALRNYYLEAVARVRAYNKCAYVSYNYRFYTSIDEMYSYPGWPGEASNVILDQHQYTVFGGFDGFSVNKVVASVSNRDSYFLQGIESSGKFLAMVGEFSNALPVPPLTISGYKPYAAVQMKTYAKYASAGWFFWSYKVDAFYGGGWSFRYGVENKFIVKTNGKWGG